MDVSMILPLTRASFKPGEAEKIIESFQNEDIKAIAKAELYYYKGKAQACSDITKQYLTSEKVELKLSTSILYTFANMTLKKSEEVEKGLNLIHNFSDNESEKSGEDQAICMFAYYISTILLHLNADDQLLEKESIFKLPYELRICAAYIVAHKLYLEEDYSQALGISLSAILFSEEVKPIIMIYLYCMIAICNINLKNLDEAKRALLIAWDMAKKDELIEPFIEHHGLLQGLMEVCVKKEDPNKYKEFTDAVITFSRGWASVHNNLSEKQIGNTLSTMEFSIAMLASRNWSNQEIAGYFEISVNTVKHYLSSIYEKLGINKRNELKQFIL